MLTPTQASAELHKLMNDNSTKWLYAFAMGGGCTMETGGHEVYQAIRDRDAHLRAILAEHRAQ